MRRMENLVLIDAIRTPIVRLEAPASYDVEASAGITADVLARELHERNRLRHTEVDRYLTAGPCGSDYSQRRGVNARTVRYPTGADALANATALIRADPQLLVIVVATDLPRNTTHLPTFHFAHSAQQVATRWRITPEETEAVVHNSYARAAECSRAQDFHNEIACRRQTDGAFDEPPTHDGLAPRSYGGSAVILTSESRAAELGLRPRAELVAVVHDHADMDLGLAYPPISATRAVLGAARVDIGKLDHVEIPEVTAATSVAWRREFAIPSELVTPRGGELAFGSLPTSSALRSMVTMLNALEQTDGSVGLSLTRNSDKSALGVCIRRVRQRCVCALDVLPATTHPQAWESRTDDGRLHAVAG